MDKINFQEVLFSCIFVKKFNKTSAGHTEALTVAPGCIGSS